MMMMLLLVTLRSAQGSFLIDQLASHVPKSKMYAMLLCD